MYAPIGIALLETDGRLVKVNSAFCRIVRDSEHGLLNKTFQELVHSDCINTAKELLTTAEKEKRAKVTS